MFVLNLRWQLGIVSALAVAWATVGTAFAVAPDATAAAPVADPPDVEGGQPPERVEDDGPAGSRLPPPRPLGAGADEELPPRFFEPNPEDRERIRRFLEKHFPELARELRLIEPRNRRVFRRRMREIMPRIIRLMHELERDEELGLLGIEEERLEIEIHRAVRLYFEADEPQERQAKRAEVERLVGEQFDVRQQRAQRSIENLEGRLQRLKRELERRTRNREQAIAQQIEMRLTSPEPPGPRPRWEQGHRPPRLPREGERQ